MTTGGSRSRTFFLSAALTIAIVVLTSPPANAETNTNTQTFTQGTDITFPDLGYASPLPSTVQVAGMPGTITNMTANIAKYSMQHASDGDVLLVGPTGVAIYLLSDVGSGFGATNLNFTFDDGATAFLPSASALSSGTVKPTDQPPIDEIMGMGAPDPPYPKTLSAFNGTNPNGTWSLYGFSDFFNGTGTEGTIDSWGLTITSASTTKPTLELTASKQRLKKKVKLTATSNVAGTLAINGPVKRTTAQLTPDMPVLIRVPQKKKVLLRLEDALNSGKKAKLNIQGTLTDRSAATAADSVKVKFKP